MRFAGTNDIKLTLPQWKVRHGDRWSLGEERSYSLRSTGISSLRRHSTDDCAWTIVNQSHRFCKPIRRDDLLIGIGDRSKFCEL